MKTVIIFVAPTRLTDAHHSVRTDKGGEIFIRAVESNLSEIQALTSIKAREIHPSEAMLNSINFDVASDRARASR